MEIVGEAVILKRNVRYYPSQQVEPRFYFSLKGANGEIVAQSEGYNQLQSALDTLNTYFPNFEIVDETGEPGA